MFINSKNNPRIKKTYKLSKNSHFRSSKCLFLLESERLIYRALKCKRVIKEVYFNINIDKSLFPRETKFFRVSESVMEKISYRNNRFGIVAVLEYFNYDLDKINFSDNNYFVVACNLEKPGNLGAIFRTLDAMGADALFVCDKVVDVFNPNVINASMGAIFSVPFFELNLTTCLSFLKKKNISIVLTNPSANTNYYEYNFKKSLALVLGSESFGLKNELLNQDYEQIKIPMLGKGDSLNVSVTTAIISYEVFRQRN